MSCKLFHATFLTTFFSKGPREWEEVGLKSKSRFKKLTLKKKLKQSYENVAYAKEKRKKGGSVHWI